MRLADKSLLRQQCFVDGAWAGSPVDGVFDPSNGSQLALVPRFGIQEAAVAVDAAARAFPKWAGQIASVRADHLRRWYRLIVENATDLALLLSSEQGKPLSEAAAEVDIGAKYVQFFAEEALRLYGETIASPRPDARIISLRQPIGVVGAITPWNFPCSMVTRKVAPALAAGCTVVLKPAPDTPLSALALARLAELAGFPKGVFNVITGDAPAIGKVLCEHPDVRFIGFTGSTAVGKILYRQAAVGVKKLGLELGGNAPFIVFEDADIDAAVEGALACKFRNSGQTCISANRFYIHDRVYKDFVERFSREVSALKVSAGTDKGCQQGPLINMPAVEKVERHIADAVKHGAAIAAGGKRHALGGTFFEPTVLTDVTSDAAVTHEETFGPVAAIYRFQDQDEVVSLANASPHGLAAYFYSRDLGRAWTVAEELETGMVGINTGLITNELVPFGGIKESGLGREGSRHGIEEFTELKYIMMAGIR